MATTPLLHLGLLASDRGRSLRFYETYFRFESAGARHYPDGTVIVRNAQGFDLALHPGDSPGRLPAFVHFGFQLPDADAVEVLLARMEADGVPILERWDEPGYVAFKCLDPDGWRGGLLGAGQLARRPEASCKQLSWWEPRSPTAPRVEGSGRAVVACPTTHPQAPPRTNSAPEPTTAGSLIQPGRLRWLRGLPPAALQHAKASTVPRFQGQGRPPGQAVQRVESRPRQP
jgi:catechol 2,3-dioxygenase-like lactoylglutathione lyase family enzyme